MSKEIKSVKGGVYLVADGSMEPSLLMEKLEKALGAGVSIIQLYNIADDADPTISHINNICLLAHSFGVPVLINNNWFLINRTLLDGVHFDKIPENFSFIENSIREDFIKGITCTNDLQVIEWADAHHFTYVSFCSMFPSPSAGACEIVSFETVKKARSLTQMPIFLAGGLNTGNLQKLSSLSFDGIAVISGIMSAADITAGTSQFISELSKIQNHES